MNNQNNQNSNPHPLDIPDNPKDKSRAQKRHDDFTKAIRKKNICEQHYGFEYYHNLHQYSKNKIHCSCPLCRAKTSGKKNYYGSNKHKQNGQNLSLQDRKQFDDMNLQEKEMYYEEINSD